MGVEDPRHNLLGKLYFNLGHQLSTYTKAYPTPTIISALAVHVIHALDIYTSLGFMFQYIISNLDWIVFFFSLCMGEYLKGSKINKQQPLWLRDVQFFISSQPYNTVNAPQEIIRQANLISLLITIHKNITKG